MSIIEEPITYYDSIPISALNFTDNTILFDVSDSFKDSRNSRRMNSRLRFSIKDDLCLLREVVEHNPYEDQERWNKIIPKMYQSTAKAFSLRAVKEHLALLLKQFAKEDMASLRRSGTEEEYMEKIQLLQEVMEMSRNFNRRKRNLELEEMKRKVTQASDEVLALQEVSKNESTHIEAVFVEDPLPSTSYFQQPSLSNSSKLGMETPSTATPDVEKSPVKRKSCQLSDACLMLLQKKESNEQKWRAKKLEMEKEHLELKRRRMELDEKYFELEREDRLLRMQIEREEHQHKMEQERKQLNMFEKLINMLERKY